MKSEQIVWTCDECGKSQVFTKGTTGSRFFPGWVTVDVVSSHGPGVSCSGEVSGERAFCCPAHAAEWLRKLGEPRGER